MYATMHESAAVAAARTLAESTVSGNAARLAVLEQQVCAEAGLWSVEAARRALGQSGGDVPQAVSMLKVWGATLPHVDTLEVADEDRYITRRLSSAYPAVPGGQWLGHSPDLAPRQLSWEEHAGPVPARRVAEQGAVATPTRSATPRVSDLVKDVPLRSCGDIGAGEDPARAVVAPPYSRATRAALLARGETGALVCLAALILGQRQEAVLVELTVSFAQVRAPHPRTGEPCVVAEVPVSEVDVVLDAQVDHRPGLAMGWGASMGAVERRAIATALLDGAMHADGQLAEHLPLNEQSVLSAVDGSATAGFVEHLRLPHYASFTSYLTQASTQEPVQ